MVVQDLRAAAVARTVAVWVACPLALSYLFKKRHEHRHGPRKLLLDLDVYKLAAETALQRRDPYTVATRIGFLFVYPPFALLLFLPLALASLATVGLLWNAASIAALQATIYLALRQVDVTQALGWTLPLTVASLGLSPVEQTLALGQLSLLLMGLVVGDLAQPDSSALKGVLIGTATGIKLVPGIFIPYLLATGQSRAAVRAVLTAASTVAVGAVAFPRDSVAFWTRYAFDAERVIPVHWPPNESLRAMLTRVLHSGAAAVRPWALSSAAVLAAAALVVALSSGDVLGTEVTAGIAATALAGLLVSPVSHHHYWVWSVPNTIYLTAIARQSGSRLVGTCAVAPVLVLLARVNRWLLPGFTKNPDPMIELRPAALAAVNSVTFASVLQLAGLAWHMTGRRLRAGGPLGTGTARGSLRSGFAAVRCFAARRARSAGAF